MLAICTHCKKEFKKLNKATQCSESCRLLDRIRIENGCWIWTGPSNWHGYGKTAYKGKTQRVHRVSYEVFKGEIEKGKLVCHKCDNPLCINPDHLWLGTHKENIQDAKKKGRMKLPMLGKKLSKESIEKRIANMPKGYKRGEKHHLNKLKNYDVFKIRTMLKEGYSQKSIADHFEVDPSCISHIKSGRLWSHI